MMKYIKIFLRTISNLKTKIYFFGCLITCILAVIFILINDLFFHYTGVFYTPPMWLLISPIVLAVLIFSLCVKDISPRTSFFTKT